MTQNRRFSKALSLRPLILVIVLGALLIIAQVLFILTFCLPGVRYESFVQIIVISLYLIFWIYTFVFIKNAKDELEIETEYNISLISQKSIEISETERDVTNKIHEFRSMITASHVYYIKVDNMTFDEWWEMLNQKVLNLDIDTRIKNSLFRNNIWTIRQLVSMTTEELIDKTGLGDISINKLRAALRRKSRYLHLELLYIANPEEPIEAGVLPFPLLDPFGDEEERTNINSDAYEKEVHN